MREPRASRPAKAGVMRGDREKKDSRRRSNLESQTQRSISRKKLVHQWFREMYLPLQLGYHYHTNVAKLSSTSNHFFMSQVKICFQFQTHSYPRVSVVIRIDGLLISFATLIGRYSRKRALKGGSSINYQCLPSSCWSAASWSFVLVIILPGRSEIYHGNVHTKSSREL